jgi:TetR/AcrR family transcriptional regulator, transcriptional repressor for nem operon
MRNVLLYHYGNTFCFFIKIKTELYNMPRIKAFEETEIIEKAKNLFQTKGYEATSMQDLIETLGISRSSLYDTFGDKHELYLRTLQEYCNENAFQLVQDALLTTDPLGFIKSIFDGVVTASKLDKDKKGCYVVNSMVEFGQSNPAVTAIITSSNNAFEKTLEKLITRAQQQKRVPANKNAKQIAQFLFNTICGMRVNAKANASAKELKQIAEIALSVLA